MFAVLLLLLFVGCGAFVSLSLYCEAGLLVCA